MCGEKPPLFIVNRFILGSPPRVRGKALPADGGRGSQRITPACAGKSYRKLGTRVEWQDHPRVCGEKDTTVRDTTSTNGSPPRVRGKVVQPEMPGELLRITPACAGKSRFFSFWFGGDWDDPRVCGEKTALHLGISRKGGSPPRVRGKVIWWNTSLNCSRITPACAGKRLISE